MTLILKSNIAALNIIGNVHGYSGPSDYVGMLDFSRGEYYTLTGGARNEYTLSDAVRTLRAGSGVIRNADGSLGSVGANVPRISYHRTLGERGVLVEAARTNFVTDPSNGASVNISSASEQVLLSFVGGDASLSSANLTLAETYMVGNTTVKRYTRSLNAAIAATLSNSGASQVQVTHAAIGTYPGLYLGNGGVQPKDTLTLGTAFASLISSAGTILFRALPSEGSPTVDNRLGFSAGVTIQSGAPHGGIYSDTTMNIAALTTRNLATRPDGAVATSAPTNRAALTANMAKADVHGVTFDANGDTVGIITSGQQARATGLGALIGNASRIALGGSDWITYGGYQSMRIGATITHAVIYNRLLTADEALAAASGWL